jgi:hypothetical protein
MTNRMPGSSDPECKRTALADGPNCISKKFTTPTDNSETAGQLQARRIAKRFFVTPETAATIARLAYGAAA